jgi:hypothetical protein
MPRHGRFGRIEACSSVARTAHPGAISETEIRGDAITLLEHAARFTNLTTEAKAPPWLTLSTKWRTRSMVWSPLNDHLSNLWQKTARNIRKCVTLAAHPEWRTGGVMSELQISDRPEADKTQILIDLAVESWRFARLFGRVVTKLDASEAPRFTNQLRYYLKCLDDQLAAAGFRIVNLEGQLYEPGIAASALNIGDFAPDDRLIIDQMMEPIVMSAEGLVRSGAVMVQKVGK